ncbi:ATP-binding protein [Luteimonas huabeiensis]|uniref:ATP-binding protein n=1 Tax=Luteimonas huabeiensis TaxID=1244513 RepID=UPI000464D903|nr:ATP-binding protein [Luteimonas huabeiensis]
MHASLTQFLATLCTLRWIAVIGQSLTILAAAQWLHMPLPALPLWAAVALLALFNAYALVRVRRGGEASAPEVFAHMLVDIAILGWLVGWTGGIGNPFASLFLLPIALAAQSLPLRWTLAVTGTSLLAYALAATLSRPLPVTHHTDAFDLHLLGMIANFLVSTGVVAYFLTRLARARDRHEQELATMRERFTRNEGILALATHAASVAHELNTPLATLTLLIDDLADGDLPAALRDDVEAMRGLVGTCRDRVRELANPADLGRPAGIRLDQVLSHWRLVRPAIELQRHGTTPPGLVVQRPLGHLLLVLLNNAADASEQSGRKRVDLALHLDGDALVGEIRDYGGGFDAQRAFLPVLFRSTKPEGLGVGLALSHATIERLGGELTVAPAPGTGTVVRFRVPLAGIAEAAA